MASHLESEIISSIGRSRIILFNPSKNSGFVPVEGTEIFVRGIPPFVSENKLAEYFGQAGEIFEIRLMMYDDMMKNRGFAFVSYMFVEAATKAMKDLAKRRFMGRKLEMNMSVSNCKLFIGGIPEFMTQEDILKELKSQGMRGIVGIFVSKNPESHTKVNRGYAVVEFMTHQCAAEVKSVFYGNLILGGKDVVLEWSKTGGRVNDSWKEVIHVGNLTWNQTTDDLRETVLKFVAQESIDSIRKVRKFAFIEMKDGTTAEELMRKLKEHYKDTRVEVNWAKASKRYYPCSRRESAMTQSDSRNHASSSGTCISGWDDSDSRTDSSSSGTEQILHELPASTSTYEDTPVACQFCEKYGEWDHTAFLAEFHETCRELENTKSPDAKQDLFYSYMLEHRGYPRFLPHLIHLCLESNYSYCFVDEYAPGEYNVHLFDFMKVMGMLIVGS